MVPAYGGARIADAGRLPSKNLYRSFVASDERACDRPDRQRPDRGRLRVISALRGVDFGRDAYLDDVNGVGGSDRRPRTQVVAEGSRSHWCSAIASGRRDNNGRSYLETTFDDIQHLWHQEFSAAGLTYRPARLVIFSSHVDSGCGPQEDVGPFYCPANNGIYLDVGFFDLLARHAGLRGFAQAYVIGHEFGHHIQQLLGIHGRVAAANQANPSGKNARSVRVELQADCLAGVWAHSAYTRDELTANDIEEKLKTAALIGDDFQRRAAGKPVDPGLFTHGSSVQRQRWLRTGFESGNPDACDTFSAG